MKDLFSGQYYVNKNIRLKTSMLRTDLCDNSYAYIVIKERQIVEDDASNNYANENLIFTSNAPFRSYISKFDNTFIDNV